MQIICCIFLLDHFFQLCIVAADVWVEQWNCCFCFMHRRWEMENERKMSEKHTQQLVCQFFLLRFVDYFYFKLLKSNLMSSTSSSNCNVWVRVSVCVCAPQHQQHLSVFVAHFVLFCTFVLIIVCCFSQMPRSPLNTLNLEMFCIAFG